MNSLGLCRGSDWYDTRSMRFYLKPLQRQLTALFTHAYLIKGFAEGKAFVGDDVGVVVEMIQLQIREEALKGLFVCYLIVASVIRISSRMCPSPGGHGADGKVRDCCMWEEV